MVVQNGQINNGHAPKPGTDDIRRHSFFIVDNQIFDDGTAKRIGPSAFTVYAYLIRRAGKKDACWPKYNIIGEDCGLSDRTVSSSIKKLVKAGLLQLVRRQYGYVYEILDSRDANFADAGKISDMQKKTIDMQILQVPTKEKNTHEEDSLGVLFARFWFAYPKKKNKGTAEKAFKQLKPDETLLKTILKAVETQKRSQAWIKDKGQFIPYPASWLNAKAWEDEEEPTEPSMFEGAL